MNSVKIRWLTDQCYEILTATDKHLIIDPGITAKGKTKEKEMLLDSITGCDYVLVTHSHYASTADLKFLEEKFKPFIFLSSLQSESVFSNLDLDYARLHPLHHGQKFEIEDIKFMAYVGKHGGKNHYTERLAHMDDNMAGKDYCHASVLGNVENYDFYITLENNLRIAFVSGEDDVKNTYSISDEFNPNILIRQYLNWPVERYAQAVCRYNAEVVIAGHHDKVYPNDEEKMKKFAEDAEKAIAAINDNVSFICPVPGEWFEIKTKIGRLK